MTHFLPVIQSKLRHIFVVIVSTQFSPFCILAFQFYSALISVKTIVGKV